MASMKIELDSAGIQAFLKSSSVESMLKGYADQIARRAGDGYETDTKQMGTRVIASAYTATKDAMQNELDNNTLLKAIR